MDVEQQILELHKQNAGRKRIAAMLGISPWTVDKYLNSRHVPPELRDRLIQLRDDKHSVKSIAKMLNKSKATISTYLHKLGLPARIEHKTIIKKEKTPPPFRFTSNYRRKELAIKRREWLIREAGGKCANCGYNRCMEALHFHHIDPATKSFNIRSRNDLLRSPKAILGEAQKCTLLCNRCHTEIHNGLAVNIKPIIIANGDEFTKIIGVELSPDILVQERLWIGEKQRKMAIAICEGPTIDPNNTTVEEIPRGVAANLMQYHPLGMTRKGVRYMLGLIHGDVAVGAALICDPVSGSNHNGCLEISRFALSCEQSDLRSRFLGLICRFLADHGVPSVQSHDEPTNEAMYREVGFVESGQDPDIYGYEGINERTLYERAKTLSIGRDKYVELLNLQRTCKPGKIKWFKKLV